MPETNIVTRKIVITQRIVFLRSFLIEDGSDLAKGNILTFHDYIIKDGDRQDKSYGLGRVGFPQTEPAVAAQVVSI